VKELKAAFVHDLGLVVELHPHAPRGVHMLSQLVSTVLCRLFLQLDHVHHVMVRYSLAWAE